MGILDEICVNLPTKYTYWSIKMLQDEAFKYTNRNDFQKISPNAYWVAHKREVLDQICVYMSPSVSEAFSLEELMEAAKKNFSRNDFQKNNPREYRVACKRKDFDEICSHMKPSRGSSENEKKSRWLSTKYPISGFSNPSPADTINKSASLCSTFLTS